MTKSKEAETIFQLDIQKGRCINCNGLFSSQVVICDNCFHVFCSHNCKDEHNILSGYNLRDLTITEKNAMKKIESDISNQYEEDWKAAQLTREKECEKSRTWIYGVGIKKTINKMHK